MSIIVSGTLLKTGAWQMGIFAVDMQIAGKFRFFN